MDKHVYICGLPGSGNRMVRDYCIHMGWPASLWHGDDRSGHGGPLIKHPRADLRCIVPVRHPGAARESYTPTSSPDLFGRECRSRVLAWASTVPALLVSYEATCMDPEGVFKNICEFLGEEYQPCPFEVYDGTRRRLEEAWH